MSKFVYTYQKILEMKEKSREDVETNYAKLIKALDTEEIILKGLCEKKEKINEEISEGQKNGIMISDITSYSEYLHYLDIKIINQTKMIKDLDNKIEMKFNELIEVKIEEKKWLNLKEKKYSEYLFESNRIEQKELDDIACKRVLI